MENLFNPIVSPAMRAKLKALSDYVRDYEIDSLKHTESIGCPNENEIPGIPVPGFIPFQLGGYEVNTLIRHDMDTSYHIGNMTKVANDSYTYMLECATRDLGFDAEGDWDALTMEQQNELGDYENEWFEPALLRFECWVSRKEGIDKREVDTIIMRLSVNCTDAPYYRTKSDETLYELEMSPKVFLDKTATPEGLWNVMIKKGEVK